MKLSSNAYSIAIGVSVLIVMMIAATYVRLGVLASEPPNEETSPTPVTVTAEVKAPPTRMPSPTPTPIPEVMTPPPPTPVIEPKNEPTPSPDPAAVKLSSLRDKPTQQSDSPAGTSSKATHSAQGDPNEGTVYTYRDGDRTLRVVLQDDLVVQETAAITPDDIVVVKGDEESIVGKQARHGQDAHPVFRSESGGGLMTLPGGVLLVLDAEWGRKEVAGFLSGNDISIDRVSDLGFLQNGFMVETEPGFASLELANALASQQGVVLSSPNWWREVETR